MTLSSRWTTCIRLRGALRWRVFSLLASLAYCISSICSKAVFNVRRDTAAGSPAVPSRWWTISLASAMRSFAIWSCPHGWIDLLTSRALERVARQWARSTIVRAPSAKRERAKAFVPGRTTPDQKSMRTTTCRSTSVATRVLSRHGAAMLSLACNRRFG